VNFVDRNSLAALSMVFATWSVGTSAAADEHAAAKPNLPASFGLIFASEQVRDLDRSMAFYTQVFGMRVLNAYSSNDFEERQLVFPDAAVAGGINIIRRGTKTEPFQGDRPVHLVIRVHDIHATCDRVGPAGGNVTRAPADAANSGVWVAMLDDPDGHRLEVVQYEERPHQ
jgi:lactoylglutathione lyase